MMTYDVRLALEDYIGCRQAGLGVNEALQLLCIGWHHNVAPALCPEVDIAAYNLLKLGGNEKPLKIHDPEWVASVMDGAAGSS